jgi:hypothetical protein
MATTLPIREEGRMAEPQRVGRGWDGPTIAIGRALSPSTQRPRIRSAAGRLEVIGTFASGRAGAWTR